MGRKRLIAGTVALAAVLAVLATLAILKTPASPPTRHRASPKVDLPDVMPPEAARPAANLREAVPEISRLSAAGQTERLNELQEALSAQVAEERISPLEIVERLRAETDTAVIDVLMGILKANPPAADRPEVLQAFLAMARGDALKDRRQAAICFLAGVWDRDGDARRALLDIARSEPDADVRSSAIAAFEEYTVRNHDVADAVNGDLLAFAADPAVRPQAISTVNMLDAGAATVRSLAGYAQDASPEVRAAVYEKLGSARAERPLALRTLEDAAARETDEAARELAAASLRRLGAR